VAADKFLTFCFATVAVAADGELLILPPRAGARADRFTLSSTAVMTCESWMLRGAASSTFAAAGPADEEQGREHLLMAGNLSWSTLWNSSNVESPLRPGYQSACFLMPCSMAQTTLRWQSSPFADVLQLLPVSLMAVVLLLLLLLLLLLPLLLLLLVLLLPRVLLGVLLVVLLVKLPVAVVMALVVAPLLILLAAVLLRHGAGHILRSSCKNC